ncbi:5'-nucleotidase [Fimbriimonas ginsengisoli]|uniref:Nucleotidase n=1 Tax=Fimbriimonas ginsengisoli Gsoil 348 TaxID=661478 RepID=A0A068NTX1_FIMGI|nr:5'-nucleotidase [Fimbriimonas ginsengisoli]AIE86210.1 nucleotidase precursor [Fimbriimonas ginsengisoli Gsoil 348]
MKSLLRPLVIGAILLSAVPVWAEEKDKPDVGPNPAAQAAADALRSFAGADGAFLAGGSLKETFNKDDMATMLQFPTDEIVVLKLTGDQILQAFERSVQFYPEQNKFFLQISGFEVTFKKKAAPSGRVVGVKVGGVPLDKTKSYTVAMPSLLARNVGYSRIWDKAETKKKFPNTTLEDVLKGKKVSEEALRWVGQL